MRSSNKKGKRLRRIDNLSLEVQALYWNVPKLWPDSTIFILGGGPSIKKLDLIKIQNRWPVIACNLAFLDFPWTDVMYFGDCKVHTWISKEDKGRYAEQFDSYKGLKVSCCPDTRDDSKIHTLFRVLKGIKLDRRTIGWNMNTGGSAINLAYHFGAKRVVLLGFDMHQVDGKSNFHDYNIIKDKRPNEVYHKFLRYFKFIAEDADKLGLEIINATEGSSLTLFPIIPFDNIVKEIEIEIESSNIRKII